MPPDLAAIVRAVEAPPPWLAPHLNLLRPIVAGLGARSVAEALNAVAGGRADLPMFVDQAALPAEEPYESFIARTHDVPTRNNAHDLFNGLMWLSYPRTKWRLNALQVEQLGITGVRGSRGAVRDALTLFDENAALMRAPSRLIDALRTRDWQALFLHRRALWQSVQLVVFGHALLEKLLLPRKPITAHVWLVDETEDATVASTLQAARLAAKPFLPLPVLGIPGWWAENESPAFYDDADVFRALNAGREARGGNDS